MKFNRIAALVGTSALVAVPSISMAQATDPLPANLMPLKVATDVLTANTASITGVIGIAFAASLVVAVIHVVRSRFGKKGGSVVK